MYDHTKQYRCTIIRGKSKKEMDDLLPAYAMVIDEICPCPTEEFDSLFNNAFQRFLPQGQRVIDVGKPLQIRQEVQSQKKGQFRQRIQAWQMRRKLNSLKRRRESTTLQFALPETLIWMRIGVPRSLWMVSRTGFMIVFQRN